MPSASRVTMTITNFAFEFRTILLPTMFSDDVRGNEGKRLKAGRPVYNQVSPPPPGEKNQKVWRWGRKSKGKKEKKKKFGENIQ